MVSSVKGEEKTEEEEEKIEGQDEEDGRQKREMESKFAARLSLSLFLYPMEVG